MNDLIQFQEKAIRREFINGEWFLSIVDIIGILTDSPNPASYWNKVRKTIEVETTTENDLLRIWQKVKMKGQDGKMYPTDCANTEGVFRIIMSVPSPKAEPFKLWLAEMGKRALDEAENPELLTERQAELYRAKGYSEEWIGRRIQSIETRKSLTDEWQQRGVKEGQEYAILTATIAKGTFGLTPTEHKELKGLDRQNLRDHMTPIELIFTALGEEATRMLTTEQDAQGFAENHDAATEGGRVAGKARNSFEAEMNTVVVSKVNYINPLLSPKTALIPKNTDEMPQNTEGV